MTEAEEAQYAAMTEAFEKERALNTKLKLELEQAHNTIEKIYDLIVDQESE